MNVLSLCDGMSCLQIAMKELGMRVDKYYASEIDKHAIKQTQLNFPNTIQLGSIVDVDVSKLDRIDFIVGGTPCTNFSFAGKRQGMSTTSNEEIYTLERYLELKEQGFEFEGESYLFWEYMRILRDVQKYNPDVIFLLENVEMGKKWERVLSNAVGLFGVHINSALVSAQNRKRIYWTNIRTKQEGLFGEVHTDIPQPKDRGILLRDILEDEVDEKYYLSDKAVNRAIRKDYSSPKVNPDKSGTVNTKNNSGQCSFDSGTTFISVNGKGPTQRKSTGRSFDKKHNYQFIKDERRMEMIQRSINADKAMTIDASYYKGFGIRGNNCRQVIKVDRDGNLKSDQTKASCFTAGAHSGGNHSDMDLICVAMRGREDGRQHIEPQISGKTNAVTTVQKDNLILGCDIRRDEGIRVRRSGKSGSLLARARNDESCGQMVIQLPRGYNKGGVHESKSPALSASSWEQNNILSQASRIRRLTPTEVSRLQTVPDWYRWECSDTQIYKMCGNGWNIETIVHILKFMK